MGLEQDLHVVSMLQLGWVMLFFLYRVITEADEVLGGQSYVTAELLDKLTYLEQVYNMILKS